MTKKVKEVKDLMDGLEDDLDGVSISDLHEDHMVTPQLAAELGLDVDFGGQWGGEDGNY